MSVSERIELSMQGSDHVRMAMAKAGHRGAAGGVQIAPAVGVDDLEARARDGDRVNSVCRAMQNMRHKGSS
jgi:hypothetical protein